MQNTPPWKAVVSSMAAICSKGFKSNKGQVDSGEYGQTVAKCSPPYMEDMGREFIQEWDILSE